MRAPPRAAPHDRVGRGCKQWVGGRVGSAAETPAPSACARQPTKARAHARDQNPRCGRSPRARAPAAQAVGHALGHPYAGNKPAKLPETAAAAVAQAIGSHMAHMQTVGAGFGCGAEARWRERQSGPVLARQRTKSMSSRSLAARSSRCSRQDDAASRGECGDPGVSDWVGTSDARAKTHRTAHSTRTEARPSQNRTLFCDALLPTAGAIAPHRVRGKPCGRRGCGVGRVAVACREGTRAKQRAECQGEGAGRARARTATKPKKSRKNKVSGSLAFAFARVRAARARARALARA